MIKDPIEVAKNLIEKGKKLNNPKMVKMGQDIITKHKNALPKQKEFIAPTRQNTSIPQQQSEDGKIIARSEQIDTNNIRNLWVDEGDEIKDPQNEKLKNFTTHTPRRPPYKPKEVTCVNCGKTQKINPIHRVNTEIYRCDACLRRMSRR